MTIWVLSLRVLVSVDEGLSDAQRAVLEPPYHGPVFTERPFLNDDGQLDESSRKRIAQKGTKHN